LAPKIFQRDELAAKASKRKFSRSFRAQEPWRNLAPCHGQWITRLEAALTGRQRCLPLWRAVMAASSRQFGVGTMGGLPKSQKPFRSEGRVIQDADFIREPEFECGRAALDQPLQRIGER
jgi:hypothetical protein